MLKNGLYNLAGAIIRAGVTILTIPIIIHLVGIEEYGLWTLVNTVVGLVTLAEGGLSVSTTVFLSRELDNRNSQKISEILTTTLGAMLVLAFLAIILLQVEAKHFLFLFPQLKLTQSTVAMEALNLGCLVVGSRLLQQLLVGIEQAFQEYGKLNLLNTLQLCLCNLGMLVIAARGGKTIELMQWQAGIACLGLIIHAIFSWQLLVPLQLKPSWDRHKSLEIARYSLMTWLTSLGSVMFTQCDRLIVGSVLDTKSLGVYAAVTSITMQINVLSAIVVQPLLPRLSQSLDHRTKLENCIKQALQVNVALVLVMGGTLLLITPAVVQLILAEAVTDEYTLAFRILTIIYSLYSVNAVGYYTLLSTGAVNVSMVIATAGGTLSLLLIFVGANLWGLLGAAIGNVGYIVTVFCLFICMKRLSISTKQWLCWIQPKEIIFLPINLLAKANK